MWVTLKEIDHLEDLDVVGRILEWTLVELVWVGWVAKYYRLTKHQSRYVHLKHWEFCPIKTDTA